MCSKILKYVIICFLITTNNLFLCRVWGQPVLNGGFEQLDNDGYPTPWFWQKSVSYTVTQSSKFRFSGKKSLHIEPTGRCIPDSSLAVFQAQDIRLLPDFTTFTVTYRIYPVSKEASFFIPYLTILYCDSDTIKKPSKKIVLDTVGWNQPFKMQTWNTFTIRGTRLNKTCAQLYFGFVVEGRSEFYADAVEISFDGKPLKDFPLQLKPVPSKADLTLLNKQVKPVIVSGLLNKGKKEFLIKEPVLPTSGVIALGESTHGGKESNILRNQITEFLIRKHQFNYIVFENDCWSTFLSDKELNSRLSSDSILFQYFGTIHQNKEYSSFLDFLRSYNTDNPQNRVSLAGMDIQQTVYLASQLKDSLEMFGRNSFKEYLEQGLWQSRYSKKTEIDTMLTLSTRIRERIGNLRKPEDTIQMEKLNLIDRMVTLFEYSLNYQQILKFNRPHMGVNVQAQNFRDSMMAVTIKTIREKDPSARIIIWAHNDHIKTGREKFQNGIYKPMGWFLKQYLGDGYRAFGITAAEGKATFFSRGKPVVDILEPPEKDCYEYYLRKQKYTALFWNWEPVPEQTKAVHRNIYSQLKMRSMGYEYFLNQFSPIDLINNMDGLFFIRTESPSENLNEK